MKTIPLTQGYEMLVDDEDYLFLQSFKWTAQVIDGKPTYAVRGHGRNRIWAHRLIAQRAGIDVSSHVDHANRNGLDNRRANLRMANSSQNSANGRKRSWKDGTPQSSKYKGVYWDRGRWVAQACKNYKTIHLGRFDSEIEAAKAYDKAARELFGEYARLNFPHEGD